jgi:hypothetical protein
MHICDLNRLSLLCQETKKEKGNILFVFINTTLLKYYSKVKRVNGHSIRSN